MRETDARPAARLPSTRCHWRTTRDFVVGLGAAILGILAMMNIAPVILEFVALLALGLSACFTVSTICSAALATLENACAGTSQRGPAS